jgi:hypothetical protein
MVRILRAFAWLRWRMFINSLENTGARDRLERFSIAMERLGPIMAGIIMIPSTIVLAILSSAGGYSLGRGDQPSMLFEAVRYVLFFGPIASVIGPLFLPAADRANPVRLLLLPIPRRTLYVAQAATALGEVWILLTVPIVLFVPIGLVAAGAIGSAVVALATGALLLGIVIGLSALMTSVLHLIARDRRRGELLALLFILIIPAISMLPGLLNAERHVRAATRKGAPDAIHLPAWAVTGGRIAFALYPTELYVQSTRSIAAGDARSAATRAAALALGAIALHGLGAFVFARVLDSPGASGGRRTITERDAWGRTLPGLTPGASAVALAHVRLALRTPRGRSILFVPLVMMGVFGVVFSRHAGGLDFGLPVSGGLGFASFTGFMCLIAALPISMNQFAVDRAGMTLSLLSPLSDAEYLTGKAVGNALISFPPAAICLIVAASIFRSGSPALWAAIPLALLATYLLVAPPAAMLSAVFPRLVDMNSIGRASNAHGLAGLLGMLSFVAAGASNVLIVFGATSLLGKPALVPVLLALWCAVAFVLNRVLFVVARRVFAARRENLALLLSDR